jgi:hypothetical protein
LEDSLIIKLSYRRRTCGLRVAARESIHIRFTAMHALPSEKTDMHAVTGFQERGGNNQSLEILVRSYLSAGPFAMTIVAIEYI